MHFSQSLQNLDENDRSSLEKNLLEIQVRRTTIIVHFIPLDEFQNEHDRMRDGYQLLKTFQSYQDQLASTNSDEENRQMAELVHIYRDQFETCEENYVQTIATFRQIQINRTKFEESCDEIHQTIEEQRQFFAQFLDHSPTIQPENLPQQIDILKRFEKELETKTPLMIETIRQTHKTSTRTDEILQKYVEDNEALKSELMVRNEISLRSLSSLLRRISERNSST